MPSIPLPKPVELQQMLAMMYGSDLKAEPGNPIPATPGNKSLVALYVDDDVPVATCAVDYNFTAQACLRPRDRFWDIPVPKIDSAFDNLFVPQPS